MAIMVPMWMLRGCIHCQVFSKFIDLVFFIVFSLVNIKQSNDYCCPKKKSMKKVLFLKIFTKFYAQVIDK